MRLCAAAVIGLLVLLCTDTGSCAERRPNILLLLADDWRSDTLGVENKIVQTPHLDRLASEGLRYTQCRVTTSICCASRATIFTGQHMARHGVDRFGVRVKDWSATYPALLRKAGYHTGVVGKFGVGNLEEEDFHFGRSYEGQHWIKQPGGEQIHVTQKNREDALAFLRDRPQDQPFCLSVSFFAPHAEDRASEQFLPQPWSEKLYAGVTIPTPKTATEEHFRRLPKFLQSDSNEGRVRWKKRFDTPQRYQEFMKNYYRLVSEVDAVIGEIVAELKSQGAYDKTFVLFVADNGYFHGERGLADKWYPYEEALRVPLIIRDPQLADDRRGGTREQLVLNLDVAPTLLAAADIETPRSMQGVPIQATYGDGRQREPAWRDFYYYEHPVILGKDRIPRSEALVWRNWRYLRWLDFDHEELYDLATDPHQERNLRDDPQHAAQLSEMRRIFAVAREQAQ